MRTNAGDGYAMAYHAGAELTNIECFQINPLLKDYNGPSCAYVSGPFGRYTVNAKGHREPASKLGHTEELEILTPTRF
jgi:succinate dehydrogenase/fumarate reductase flavoprotein subunit